MSWQNVELLNQTEEGGGSREIDFIKIFSLRIHNVQRATNCSRNVHPVLMQYVNFGSIMSLIVWFLMVEDDSGVR